MDKTLPEIPAKRYFTIGEVSELCGVKAYVLRYWEQEFTQLRPVKRRGNRRYYQHHEVLLIRRIRELLYEEGFTISGARNRLPEMPALVKGDAPSAQQPPRGANGHTHDDLGLVAGDGVQATQVWLPEGPGAGRDGLADGVEHSAGALALNPLSIETLRNELLTIRRLLEP